MIKHPQDRADRRRLAEYYGKKKYKGAAKKRDEIRDQESEDELRSYRSGDVGLNERSA